MPASLCFLLLSIVLYSFDHWIGGGVSLLLFFLTIL